MVLSAIVSLFSVGTPAQPNNVGILLRQMLDMQSIRGLLMGENKAYVARIDDLLALMDAIEIKIKIETARNEPKKEAKKV